MAVIFRLKAVCDRCGASADFEADMRHAGPYGFYSPDYIEHAANPDDLPAGWRYDKLASGLVCPSCQDEHA
jgi:hypothetical protein